MFPAHRAWLIDANSLLYSALPVRSRNSRAQKGRRRRPYQRKTCSTSRTRSTTSPSTASYSECQDERNTKHHRLVTGIIELNYSKKGRVCVSGLVLWSVWVSAVISMGQCCGQYGSVLWSVWVSAVVSVGQCCGQYGSVLWSVLWSVWGQCCGQCGSVLWSVWVSAVVSVGQCCGQCGSLLWSVWVSVGQCCGQCGAVEVFMVTVVV